MLHPLWNSDRKKLMRAKVSFSELREPILIIFDVLESSHGLLFIFQLFLKLGSNPLDEPVVFRAYVVIFWQIFVIFWSRHPRTGPSVSKTLAMHPYLICYGIRGHSDPHSMNFAWFSIFWVSDWIRQNPETRFGPVEQWNRVPHQSKYVSHT